MFLIFFGGGIFVLETKLYFLNSSSVCLLIHSPPPLSKATTISYSWCYLECWGYSLKKSCLCLVVWELFFNHGKCSWNNKPHSPETELKPPEDGGVRLPTWRGNRKRSRTQSSHPMQCASFQFNPRQGNKSISPERRHVGSSVQAHVSCIIPNDGGMVVSSQVNSSQEWSLCGTAEVWMKCLWDKASCSRPHTRLSKCHPCVFPCSSHVGLIGTALCVSACVCVCVCVRGYWVILAWFHIPHCKILAGCPTGRSVQLPTHYGGWTVATGWLTCYRNRERPSMHFTDRRMNVLLYSKWTYQ